MRQIASYPLWIGHSGDARNLQVLLDVGIEAIVDLAMSEPPIAVTRELIYCRFPLLDASGNHPRLLRVAAETVARFINAQIPTLVFCGAGLSRSPCIAAAGFALALDRPADDCLRMVTADGARDVSPQLWHDVTTALAIQKS
jgi:protein-tyrosine phosphatase